MTQRIFDVDNPQDIKDLFDILPDKIKKIMRNLNAFDCYDKDGNYIYSCYFFAINWRDKTGIARPVGEMIGNIGSPICHFNQDCPIHDRSIPQEIYDLLERTRKALDKAKWWLHEIVESHRCTPISTAEMALKEIAALEQKDK